MIALLKVIYSCIGVCILGLLVAVLDLPSLLAVFVVYILSQNKNAISLKTILTQSTIQLFGLPHLTLSMMSFAL